MNQKTTRLNNLPKYRKGNMVRYKGNVHRVLYITFDVGGWWYELEGLRMVFLAEDEIEGVK
jgi:hypothetical protein